jgi:signal transduction histidine kinase
MRFSIRVKQIVGVTSLVVVVVVTLSALYVTRLVDVVLQESYSRGRLLARATWNQARAVVANAPGDPYAALRADPGIRSILVSSLLDESVTSAAIVDPGNVAVAHDDPTMVGRYLEPRTDMASLVEDTSVIRQLGLIYARDGHPLEVRQRMVLNDQEFGSIQIGISTALMRKELDAWLWPAILMGAATLGVGVLVAALMAQLVLKPIHVIRSGLTRLGKGEFGVTLDLPEGDEFGELGSFFNSVSQQLSADRSLLAGQKAHLQSAVEHLEDAVALFNPDGELLFANPAMREALPSNALGRALRGLLADGHPYRTIVEETLATRTSRGPVQVTAAGIRDSGRSGDGRPGSDGGDATDEDLLLLITHAIAGMNGELVGVLLVARNIAYLSRVQSTLAYSHKLVALGRLTAGIAHEVKNPLNAMMIHLELLRTKIRAGSIMSHRQPDTVTVSPRGLGLAPGAQAPVLSTAAQGALEHVAVIESEVRRLDEVVQGFLKFTRPEDLRLQPVRVMSVLEEILPVIEPEARKNGVRIQVDCPPSAPAVNGDASMLRQAFLNLAINACQAMPTGGTLRMICSAKSALRVEVRIEDTGVGIDPKNLGKIFDLYFTTKDHGTGIGLSMVYRIVQLHDGEIEVQSTPGRGTMFRVLLPRAQ